MSGDLRITNQSATLTTSIPFPPKVKVLPLILAAGLSGLPPDVITHPILRIKTIQMTQGAGSQSVKLKSVIDIARAILKTEGPFGFFRGLSPVLLTTVPATGLYFTAYHRTKETLPKGPLADFIAGLAGQIAGSIFWVPNEVVKELRQVTIIKPQLRGFGTFQLVKHVVKTEGVQGLYRGTLAQFATFGPFNGIGTAMSSSLVRWRSQDSQQSLPLHEKAFCNFIGFGFAGAVTGPFDVIKTRLQVGAANPELFPYRSIVGCIKHVIKTEGVAALGQGALTRALWLGTRQGIAFTTFPYALAYFKG